MGAILAEEWPYACVVFSDCATTVCANCFSRSSKTLARCSRCRFAHFCGKTCQSKGWKNHMRECDILAKFYPRVPTAMARLMCHIIIKQKAEQHESEHVAFNGRTFANLMAHTKEILQDPEKSEFFFSLSHVLRDLLGNEKLCSPSILLEIFGKVTVNAFVISDDDLKTIGLGLYIGLSRLDHSCEPDAFVLFNGKRAILKSLNDVHVKYTDDIRIAYCECLDLKNVRCAQLNDQFFFTCDCIRCCDVAKEAVANSARCFSCNNGYCILNEDLDGNVLSCNKCLAESGVISRNAVEMMEKVEVEVGKLKSLSSESADESIKLYYDAEKVLSHLNITLCHLAEQLWPRFLDNKDYNNAATFIEKTLPCFEYFYPDCYPPLSLQYFKAGKLHALNDATLEIAAQRLQQAVTSLSVSHGSEHHITKQAHILLQQVQQDYRYIKCEKIC